MHRPTLLIDHTIRPQRAVNLQSMLCDEIGDKALIVSQTPAETEKELPEANGLITKQIDDQTLDLAPKLKWLHVLSAGTDHLDYDLLRSNGIALTNSSGIHTEPIAEQVLAYILSFERRLPQAYHQQSRKVWNRVDGGEARGKTVGIIGVGSIGTRVAEVCTALGMKVIGTKRDVTDVPSVLDECFAAEEYHEMIIRSDYLVLTCPLTEDTKDLIGWDELQLLGKGFLINVARGQVVNEEDLANALQLGRIQGAALDVFNTEPLPPQSPLWDHPNVIITPHMAGSTPHKPERWREIILQNYQALSSNGREGYINRVL